jgi:hydrogenase expression/formation protein HypE
MADTAREAGVQIVAGDTKVVEGKGGLFINTAGLGVRPAACGISASALHVGDALLVTGTLGDHHAVILTQRLKMETRLQSDCAPLNGLVAALLERGLDIHAIRDITRGGLATVANELAAASGKALVLEEAALPVKDEVKALCGILGLDPLTMGNEGKLLIALPAEQAEAALDVLHAMPYGRDAALAGCVEEGQDVHLKTVYGGRRRLLPLRGEGLPRIC